MNPSPSRAPPFPSHNVRCGAPQDQNGAEKLGFLPPAFTGHAPAPDLLRHSHMPRLTPRPSRYATCPVETGAAPRGHAFGSIGFDPNRSPHEHGKQRAMSSQQARCVHARPRTAQNAAQTAGGRPTNRCGAASELTAAAFRPYCSLAWQAGTAHGHPSEADIWGIPGKLWLDPHRQ